jgi:hypothetical protein
MLALGVSDEASEIPFAFLWDPFPLGRLSVCELQWG